MIKVTRLNKTEFWVNVHQIEFIEALPDTTISMMSGRKLVVLDKIEDVLNRITQYRHSLTDNTANEL